MSTFQNPLANVPFDPEQWQPTGSDEDKTSRLLASIIVCGLYLHVEAIAVKESDTGIQVAQDDTFEDDVSRYQDIQDTAFETVTIRDREYIIVATPYGA